MSFRQKTDGIISWEDKNKTGSTFTEELVLSSAQAEWTNLHAKYSSRTLLAMLSEVMDAVVTENTWDRNAGVPAYVYPHNAGDTIRAFNATSTEQLDISQIAITGTTLTNHATPNLTITAHGAFAASGLAGGILGLNGGAKDGAGVSGYVRIGTGTPTHMTPSTGALYVTGMFETNDAVHFNASVTFYNGGSITGMMQFNTAPKFEGCGVTFDDLANNVATTNTVSGYKNRAGAILQVGDNILKSSDAWGWDGAAYRNAGYTLWEVGTGTPAAGTSMPGKWSIWTTPTGTITPVKRLSIDSTGAVAFESLATIAATSYVQNSGTLWGLTCTPSSGGTATLLLIHAAGVNWNSGYGIKIIADAATVPANSAIPFCITQAPGAGGMDLTWFDYTGAMYFVGNGSISAPTDLTLGARSATITLNQNGNTTLTGFTATSIVGALNEVKSGVTTATQWDRTAGSPAHLTPHTATDRIQATSYTDTTGALWALTCTPGSASTATVMKIYAAGPKWNAGCALQLIADAATDPSTSAMPLCITTNGGSGLTWFDYLGALNFGGSNTIRTAANGDLSLSPNGSGNINLNLTTGAVIYNANARIQAASYAKNDATVFWDVKNTPASGSCAGTVIRVTASGQYWGAGHALQIVADNGSSSVIPFAVNDGTNDKLSIGRDGKITFYASNSIVTYTGSNGDLSLVPDGSGNINFNPTTGAVIYNANARVQATTYAKNDATVLWDLKNTPASGSCTGAVLKVTASGQYWGVGYALKVVVDNGTGAAIPFAINDGTNDKLWIGRDGKITFSGNNSVVTYAGSNGSITLAPDGSGNIALNTTTGAVVYNATALVQATTYAKNDATVLWDLKNTPVSGSCTGAVLKVTASSQYWGAGYALQIVADNGTGSAIPLAVNDGTHDNFVVGRDGKITFYTSNSIITRSGSNGSLTLAPDGSGNIALNTTTGYVTYNGNAKVQANSYTQNGGTLWDLACTPTSNGGAAILSVWCAGVNWQVGYGIKIMADAATNPANSALPLSISAHGGSDLTWFDYLGNLTLSTSGIKFYDAAVAAATTNIIYARKSRGAGVVNAGDSIFKSSDAWGYSGSNYRNSGYTLWEVGAGTPSDTSMPGKYSIYTTPDTSVTPLDRFDVGPTGLVCVGAYSLPASITVATGTLLVRGASEYAGSQTVLDTKSVLFGTTAGTVSQSSLTWNTTQSPAALVLGLGTVSRNFLICDAAYTGTAYGHVLSPHPTLFWHDASATTTHWMSAWYDGANGRFNTGLGSICIGTGAPAYATAVGALYVTGIIENAGRVTGAVRDYWLRSSMANNTTITLPSGVTGIGEIFVGDKLAHCRIWFSSTGDVEILESSDNCTGTVGTTSSFNIYAASSLVTLQNLLGVTTYVSYVLFTHPLV